MTGGRVWEFSENDSAYVLRYQFGETEHIQTGTLKSIDSDSPFAALLNEHTIIVHEDATSNERGSRELTLTGVGEITNVGKYSVYPYALAFTAHAIDDEFRDTLVVVSAAVTTALRNLKAVEREHRMKRDLDQAWQIQHGLVPDHSRQFLDYDLYGVSVPESVVGGDYFDYLSTSERDRLGVVISDAASKGLPAAVQALFVSGAMRMGVSFETKITSLISRLNSLICQTFPLERFVSLCYCELTHSSNGLVLYANAGHCPPLHINAASGSITHLEPTGGILGIVENQQFRVENVNLGRGDVLVLYTDGVIDAQNRSGQAFGLARLEEIVVSYRNDSAEVIALSVLEQVQQYSHAGKYSDDKTLIVIKRGLPAS